MMLVLYVEPVILRQSLQWHSACMVHISVSDKNAVGCTRISGDFIGKTHRSLDVTSVLVADLITEATSLRHVDLIC